MRLIRYSHSCVRLEVDGVVIVIDPGIWSEPEALHGADAVLITHEHADHADQVRLAGLSCPIFAPAGAALPQIEFHLVHPKQRVTVAGLDTTIGGGHHAPVLDDQHMRGDPATLNNRRLSGFLTGALPRLRSRDDLWRIPIPSRRQPG